MKNFALIILLTFGLAACKKENLELKPQAITSEQTPMSEYDESVEPSDCICTEIFAPVCGVDGRTYGNACLAECRNVEIASAGECETQAQDR